MNSESFSLLNITLCQREEKATVAFQIAFDGSHLSLHIMHYYHYYSPSFLRVLIQEYTEVPSLS